MTADVTTYAIAALATGGVVLRPWRLPEAIWAVAGAVLLVVLGLLPLGEAWSGILRGVDVYLFLIGMMLLAELARQEGLFDWLAGFAVVQAKGSGARLLLLVYGVGVIVTVFLSNDATAVVLTPAVYAAARAAGAKPLPYLLLCAFVANAASFVLPISNPANLVIYGRAMPPLADWLVQFTLPSIAAIVATYLVLRLRLAGDISAPLQKTPPATTLSRGGRLTGYGLIATALVLLCASAFGWQLGLPTFITGALTAAFVLIGNRQSPWPLLRGVPWSVIPLVAGLFVLVEALQHVGLIDQLAAFLRMQTERSVGWTASGAGAVIAVICNLMNNLPAGLIASSTMAAAQAPHHVIGAVLIGVDLGPNLSITGSLATIIWLIALRRDGETISAWAFLKLGMLVMPPALLAALAALALRF
ncbi:MAG TPA: arsenic transporter [Dongiaceae bacterium]|nr:arsenic transporter [Dongiaceae bacterium]